MKGCKACRVDLGVHDVDCFFNQLAQGRSMYPTPESEPKGNPVTPSNHSPEVDPGPEAEAAYTAWIEPRTSELSYPSVYEGFMAGVAATKAQQYAATREAIRHWVEGYFGPVKDEYLNSAIDALLADSGPLLDAAEVRRQALEEWAAYFDHIEATVPLPGTTAKVDFAAHEVAEMLRGTPPFGVAAGTEKP